MGHFWKFVPSAKAFWSGVVAMVWVAFRFAGVVAMVWAAFFVAGVVARVWAALRSVTQ